MPESTFYWGHPLSQKHFYWKEKLPRKLSFFQIFNTTHAQHLAIDTVIVFYWFNNQCRPFIFIFIDVNSLSSVLLSLISLNCHLIVMIIVTVVPKPFHWCHLKLSAESRLCQPSVGPAQCWVKSSSSWLMMMRLVGDSASRSGLRTGTLKRPQGDKICIDLSC